MRCTFIADGQACIYQAGHVGSHDIAKKNLPEPEYMTPAQVIEMIMEYDKYMHPVMHPVKAAIIQRLRELK